MPDKAKELDLVVVCGLSGAGKSTASNALEDMGYFCVDNLPVSLLIPMVDFSLASGGQLKRLALVATVHHQDDARKLSAAMQQLKTGCRVRLLFLEAATEVILRRYSETRRRHPLDQTEKDLDAAIHHERTILHSLSSAADIAINTSGMGAQALQQLLIERLSAQPTHVFAVGLQSFGFKYGVPKDSNLLFDARFLPNPYFVDELRPLTGENSAVSNYVLDLPEAQTFLSHIDHLIQTTLPMYIEQGISHLQLAIGCTGGRHRSVALAIELANRLENLEIHVSLLHRDHKRK